MTGQPPGRLGRGAEAVSGCKSIRKYLASLIGHSQSRRPHKCMAKEGSLRSRLILILTALHCKLILCETQTEMKSPCIPHKHLNCQEQTQQEKLMPCFKKQQINWLPIALSFSIYLVIPISLLEIIYKSSAWEHTFPQEKEVSSDVSTVNRWCHLEQTPVPKNQN